MSEGQSTFGNHLTVTQPWRFQGLNKLKGCACKKKSHIHKQYVYVCVLPSHFYLFILKQTLLFKLCYVVFSSMHFLASNFFIMFVLVQQFRAVCYLCNFFIFLIHIFFSCFHHIFLVKMKGFFENLQNCCAVCNLLLLIPAAIIRFPASFC